MEGLELNTLGTVAYFSAVGLWSAVVAYFVIFRAFEQGNSHGGHDTHGASHSAGHAPKAHGVHHAAPVEPTYAKPFRGFSPYEGFKSFAQGETVTIDDIVRGLARESGAAAIHETRETPDHHEHVHTGVPETSAQASEFLRALVAGDRDTAFEILRTIEEFGEGAEPFLKRVLTALEAALDSRLHGKACDLTVLDILGSCDTPVIEKLVEALGTAKGKHGPKLALTRAFSALPQH